MITCHFWCEACNKRPTNGQKATALRAYQSEAVNAQMAIAYNNKNNDDDVHCLDSDLVGVRCVCLYVFYLCSILIDQPPNSIPVTTCPHNFVFFFFFLARTFIVCVVNFPASHFTHQIDKIRD